MARLIHFALRSSFDAGYVVRSGWNAGVRRCVFICFIVVIGIIGAEEVDGVVVE